MSEHRPQNVITLIPRDRTTSPADASVSNPLAPVLDLNPRINMKRAYEQECKAHAAIDRKTWTFLKRSLSQPNGWDTYPGGIASKVFSEGELHVEFPEVAISTIAESMDRVLERNGVGDQRRVYYLPAESEYKGINVKMVTSAYFMLRNRANHEAASPTP